MKTEARLIGLTGTNGSGKGEVAAYLQKKGYAYFSLSDVIRVAIRKDGKEDTRDNLIEKGNELRKKYGPDILARMAMERVKDKAVIDSIRNPSEIEYLRKEKEFILLAIDAPVELRYERVKQRGRQESVSTLEEFIKKEKEEMTDSEKGQQLHSCMKMADIIIMNDGTLEDLHLKLEEIA
ncbi:MAG: AAA family ATPase [Candidatus Aminicenantes bacterium]|nr:MAG: AAA family ATPase [Candidatus Aminicenantes bacterium]